MKGYLLPVANEAQPRGQLAEWESLATGAVGTVIEFWGFKANHGRVWAVLYLRDKALSAAELQATLGLSKGAVSMVTRELEQWGVVRRVRPPHSDSWHFEAETDLLKMVGRVISEREARFVERIEQDLEQAERLAARAGADRAVLLRLGRMRSLAHRAHQAVTAFITTARLDFRGVGELLVAARGQLSKRIKS
jgi:HTH-type transcriptional regulator, glycine betaine synthesis regulator